MPIEDQKVRKHARTQGLKNHTLFSAIAELVDNAEDAQAKRIKIEMASPQVHEERNAERITTHHLKFPTMTLDGSARFLCEEILVVVDSGRGLSNLDDLFDLASNKRAERQSQARGIHGMGAKNAIDRLGRHAIVVSKCRVGREDQLNATQNLYSYRLGVFPFGEADKKPSRTGENDYQKHEVRRTAKLNMSVLQESADELYIDKWHTGPGKDDSAEILQFLQKHGPFSSAHEGIDFMIKQLSLIENIPLSQTHGTIILIWGLHSKTSEPSLSEYLNGCEDQILNTSRRCLHDYLTKYRAVQTQGAKGQPVQNTSMKNPLVFVQGYQVHARPFRAYMFQESLIKGEYRPRDSVITITYEMGQVKPQFADDLSGMHYFWENRIIRRKTYPSNPETANYALFIDMTAISQADQYKTHFLPNLNRDHMYKKTPDKELTFERLEETLKSRFVEFSKHMRQLAQEKVLWYDIGPGMSKDILIMQCFACGKSREITPKFATPEFLDEYYIEHSDENQCYVINSDLKFECNQASVTASQGNPCDVPIEHYFLGPIGAGAYCQQRSRCQLCRQSGCYCYGSPSQKPKSHAFLSTNNDCFKTAKGTFETIEQCREDAVRRQRAQVHAEERKRHEEEFERTWSASTVTPAKSRRLKRELVQSEIVMLSSSDDEAKASKRPKGEPTELIELLSDEEPETGLNKAEVCDIVREHAVSLTPSVSTDNQSLRISIPNAYNSPIPTYTEDESSAAEPLSPEYKPEQYFQLNFGKKLNLIKCAFVTTTIDRDGSNQQLLRADCDIEEIYWNGYNLTLKYSNGVATEGRMKYQAQTIDIPEKQLQFYQYTKNSTRSISYLGVCEEIPACDMTSLGIQNGAQTDHIHGIFEFQNNKVVPEIIRQSRQDLLRSLQAIGEQATYDVYEEFQIVKPAGLAPPQPKVLVPPSVDGDEFTEKELDYPPTPPSLSQTELNVNETPIKCDVVEPPLPMQASTPGRRKRPQHPPPEPTSCDSVRRPRTSRCPRKVVDISDSEDDTLLSEYVKEKSRRSTSSPVKPTPNKIMKASEKAKETFLNSLREVNFAQLPAVMKQKFLKQFQSDIHKL